MSKLYVAKDGREYYTGETYIVQDEIYPVTTSDITLAKKYKSKKRLQFIIDNLKIPSILRDWKVYEVEE